MSKERKKAELKPITKLEPKQRVKTQSETLPKPIVKVVEKPKVVEPLLEPISEEKQKVKRAENKYIRLALDAKQDERLEVSTKIKNGEVKWAFYATDGDKGYHHYLVTKKTK
jgi:hypothetical protein